MAAAAGLGTATAYRHFTSAADVTDAYVDAFLDDFDARCGARLDDVPRAAGDAEAHLRELDRLWVASILDWGPALTHVRSPDGFLARRARREGAVHRSLARIEPALDAVLVASRGGPPPARELAYAIAVWNAVADPREVLASAPASAGLHAASPTR